MNRLPLLAFFVFDLLVIATILVGDEQINKMALDWLLRYSCLPAAYLGWREFRHSHNPPCPFGRLLLTGAYANLLACVALGCLILTLLYPFSHPLVLVILVVNLFRLVPGMAAFVVLSPFCWLACRERRRYLNTVLMGQGFAWFFAALVFGQQPQWHLHFLHQLFNVPYWAFTVLLGGLTVRLLSPPQEAPKP